LGERGKKVSGAFSEGAKKISGTLLRGEKSFGHSSPINILLPSPVKRERVPD